MTRHPPPLAILLGLGGLIPFAACGIGALTLAGGEASHALHALIAYGATILAFLGGVHWGFALSDGSNQTSQLLRGRLVLGVVPSLIGWTALLATFVGLPNVGLFTLLTGFIATIVVETRASREGLMPAGYIGLRWMLTAGAVLCLGSVLLARLLGVDALI